MSESSSPTATVLRAESLAIGYGEKIIAQDINVSMNKGEMICLLGQNGVGKSTLLKTLSLLNPIISGSVSIHGSDINAIDRRALGKLVGIVTTEKVGTPYMTVRELVSMGRYPYSNWLGTLSSEDHKIVQEAISSCRIDYLADQSLQTLSDGQRQKAMIARVLAQQTEIIILDEPTAHLDLVNRGEVMKLLSDIKVKQKKSILISTHELPLSIQFSDQLWLMNYNAPLVTGVPEDLAVSGELSKIFYNEFFDLDVLNGRVLIREEPVFKIALQGDSLAKEWTVSALKRHNIQVSTEVDDRISVSIQEGLVNWEINIGAYHDRGKSLKTLLEYLESKIKTQA